MPIATNPETGEVVRLSESGQWEKAQTAINPETKEMLAFDGRDWAPVPASKGVIDQIEAVTRAIGTTPGAEMSWADVPGAAVRNAPASALQFGKDLVQPIIHPIDTAVAIKNIGAGVLQKIGILSGDDSEKYADAVGKFFVDRYGSEEAIKKAIATDPVGVLADVSTVLTLGGSAAARAPGIAGKVGHAAEVAGKVIDPITAVGAGVKAAGHGAATVIGGLGTHTGGAPIRAAAAAGAEGGARAEAFRDNMRGNAAIEDVVTDAKTALQNMRNKRGTEYRAAMKEIGQDQTVLDFSKVDAAAASADKVKVYKGQDLSPTTQGIRQQITTEINAWKALDPAEFHTAEGLDALKQKIGDIRDGTKPNTPERVVGDRIYNAVRQTIVDQAPEYAKVMKGYETASDLIRDIEKTLSLNPKANIDTAVRKLQSTLRNNVHTDYGRRENLAKFLVNAGAPHLLTKLAGQSLSAAMPRGLGKITAGGLAAGGGYGAFSGALGPLAIPLVAAGLAVSSPRLVGEAAHAAGQASRHGTAIGRSSFQVGRETSASKEKRR